MISLQNIVFPEAEICNEISLYVDLGAGVTLGHVGHGLDFNRGGHADFGTYFNLFNAQKWVRNCALDGLFLALLGEGDFSLRVTRTAPGLKPHVILKKQMQLGGPQEILVDLSGATEPECGVISFSLKARSKGTFKGARFLTKQPNGTFPSLAVCITTFQRDAQINATIKRLSTFLGDFQHGDQISVFVVDNGQSLPPSHHDKITVITNRNLGGAGGFARGLMTAQNAGLSHCLFMDDDATFHLENIGRAYAFLTLAHDPRTAIAGAMISNARGAHMWENGATFNRTCHPIASGTDLRDFDEVVEMEMQSCETRPPHFYGGWWFFAFPIAQVVHYPFPFFVRGDDINFSLANDFAIQTLSGVVSFQDDFSKKESATTLYLDLRNHLVQHMTIGTLNIGAFSCARIALWFILRNAAMFRYETCDALLLAWQDVIQGPDFFIENVDMSVRREMLKAIVSVERPRPLAELDLSERHFLPRRFLNNRVSALVGKWTLNGHLVPFFGLLANHVVRPTTDRELFCHIWGASKVSYIDETQGYSVEISRIRFLKLMWRSVVTGAKFLVAYRALRLAYRREYAEMTSRRWWEKTLQKELDNDQ